MSNSKPLYSLTVDEYIELNRKVLSEEVERALDIRLSGPTSSKVSEDIIFIDAAAELTGYKKASIYSKVCRLEMPVLSRLRPLTFSKKALIAWISDGRPQLTESSMKSYF